MVTGVVLFLFSNHNPSQNFSLFYPFRSAPMAMSGAPAASRVPQFRINAVVYRNFKLPISMVSCSSTSTPGKVRKFSIRKNHLREKLLKTLTKPYSSWGISELPDKIPGDFPGESSLDENCSPSFEGQYVAGSGNGSGEEVEELDIQELRVAEVSDGIEIMDNRVTSFSKGSFYKIGVWFLGAYIFQNICAAWFLGSVDILHENGNSSEKQDKNGILDVGINGKDKSKWKLFGMGDKKLEGGGVSYLDEEDIDKKIEEIQLMAREAREEERLNMEKNGSQSDDNDDEDEDSAKRGIEKEVYDRLVKLSKTLGNNAQKKLSVSFANNVKRDDSESDKVGKDDLNEDNNVALMFKKRYKFRGSLSGMTDKPKGFTSSGHPSAPKEAKGNGDIGGGDFKKDAKKKQSVESSKSLKTPGKKLVGRDKKKPGQRLELVESELNGIKQDNKEGSFGTVKSSKANVLGAPAISGKQNLSNQKDSSKGTGNLLSAETERKTSERETDFWWLSLPYVLVIFMHKDLYDEGPRGPYCIKSSSGSNSKFSYTVAFEDRGDATNFCHILRTFFSDMGGFSADVVPLSNKELKEAVESQIIKVMVVKKGQLKLYAGQPLPEVEMTLRSILEQNLNARGNYAH